MLSERDNLKNALQRIASLCSEQSVIPDQLKDFLQKRGINPNELTCPIPRFVRIRPKTFVNRAILAEELKMPLSQAVQLTDCFVAIPAHVKIQSCRLYQDGLIAGMDIASSIPVSCLDVEALPKGAKLLDMCAAPGLKTILAADSNPQLQIVATQVNPRRAAILQSLLKKYEVNKRVEVLIKDGRSLEGDCLYDRVLVDVECTHEGAVRQIKKYSNRPEGDDDHVKHELSEDSGIHNKGKKSQLKKLKAQRQRLVEMGRDSKSDQCSKSKPEEEKEPFESHSNSNLPTSFLSEDRLASLFGLQFQLLSKGFRLLKAGGVLVYSTCSLDEQQNETVVRRLLTEFSRLNKQKEAVGIDCTQSEYWSQIVSIVLPEKVFPLPYVQGTLKGTIRLSPTVSCCGGMFVAKIAKKSI